MLKKGFRIMTFAMIMLMLLSGSVFASENLLKDFSFEYNTRDDLMISTPIITVAGAALTKIAPNTTADISVKVKKLSTGSEPAALCAGLYDSENELKTVDFSTGTLTGGGTENELKLSFNLGTDAAETDYIRVFVWSDLNNNMVPYVKTYDSRLSVSDNIAGDISAWKMYFADDQKAWAFATADEYKDMITNSTYNRTYGYNALVNQGYRGVGSTVYQDITVKPNTVYLAHFGVLSQKSGFIFEVLDNSGTIIASLNSVAAANTYFRTNKLVFNSGNNTSLRIQFRDNSTETYASYIGDVTVTENLLLYGSFEDSATNYYPGNYGVTNGTIEHTYSDAYDGYGSAVLENTDSSKTTTMTYSAGADVQNAGAGRYALSCAIKYNADTADGQTDAPVPVLRANYKNASGAAVNTTARTVTPLEDGWSRMALYTDLTDEIISKGSFDVNFYVARQNGDVYVDDFKLMKIDSDNILYSGDFEMGTIYPWKDSYAGKQVTLELDRQNVHSGNYALKVTSDKAAQDVTQHDITERIQASGDGTYKLSGWMKYEPLDDKQFAMLKLNAKVDGAPVTIMQLNQNSTAIDENGFRYFEGTFTTNTDSIASVTKWSEAYVSAYVTNGRGTTFYLDDVRLEKVKE